VILLTPQPLIVIALMTFLGFPTLFLNIATITPKEKSTQEKSIFALWYRELSFPGLCIGHSLVI